MSPHWLSKSVMTYINKAGVEKEGRCHLFRHTMATLMLENGADIRFIQQILGHAQLSTTEIYTHVAIHKLKEIHTVTHPARADRYQAPEATDTASEADLFADLDREASEELH